MRSTSACAASPVPRSTESRGFISVGSGFIAARTTTGSPFVIPASRPAGVVRAPDEAGVDLVVRLRAAHPREREAVAHLDALDGLDPHQREREPRVEPVGLLGVRAEARRAALGDDLDDAAERVAVLAGRVRRLAHAVVAACAADLERPAGDRDADRREQRLGDRAGGDVRRRVARARALERVADVVVAVLEHSREIGVAGARQRHGLRALAVWLALGLPGAHPPRPVLVVEIADDERQRRSERVRLAQPGEHLDGVGLELLARAAAVAELAPPQVGVDRGAVEPQARRQAGEHGHERGAVRLSCGDEAECHAASLEARRRHGAFLWIDHSSHPAGDRRRTMSARSRSGPTCTPPGGS